MESLEPFLPELLLQALTQLPEEVSLPVQQHIQAGLLFCDVDGFTNLTERLQGEGKEGAEDIARLINTSFAPAIQTVRSNGGSVVSFGGDAIFSVFPGEHGGIRARKTADLIEDQFDELSLSSRLLDEVEMTVSQAVHTGEIDLRHLGGEDRRTFIVCGEPVRELVELSETVSPGTVITSKTVERAGGNSEPKTPRVHSLDGLSRDLMSRYLAENILNVLDSFEGQYRQATAAFVETPPLNVDEMQQFYTTLVRTLEIYGGTLLKTDLSKHGTKWLCVFGVPSMHERDPVRAATGILHLKDELASEEAVSFRAGLASGTVANIKIGSRDRKSFDVMGNPINTAARVLESSNNDQIKATAEIVEENRELAGSKPETLEAKGKEKPLILYRLRGRRKEKKKTRTMAPLVGRDEEMSYLRQKLNRMLEGNGSVIGIKAEAGLGKSRLKYELKEIATRQGISCFEGHAPSFGGRPHQMIRDLLRDILDLPEGAEEEKFRNAVREIGEKLNLSRVNKHHLAHVLGARFEDDHIDQLDGQTVRRNNRIAVQTLLTEHARSTPTLFVLEDMHWADETTRRMVKESNNILEDVPGLLLLLYRPGYNTPDHIKNQELELKELKKEASGKLLDALFAYIDSDIRSRLVERSGGNPFFAEELVLHMQDQGMLDSTPDGFRTTEQTDIEELPLTINNLISARYDHLPPAVRKVVRRASVIGRNFSKDLLLGFKEIHGYVNFALTHLVRREILLPRQEKGSGESYQFKHELSRDVAYETILKENREQFHRCVADTMETLYEDQIDDHRSDLGHHREKANQKEEAWNHYRVGAQLALEKHSFEEAERFFEAALKQPVENSLKRTNTRTLLGEALDKMGKIESALTQFQISASEARRNGHIEEACWAYVGQIYCYVYSGESDRGREAGEQALTLLQGESPHPRLSGEIKMNLAILEQKTGHLQKAEKWYKKALKSFQKLDYVSNQATCIENIGTLYHIQDKLDEALNCYEQAKAMFEDTKEYSDLARVTANIAGIHLDKGEYGKGRSKYERAIQLCRKTGYRFPLGYFYTRYASLLRRSDEPVKKMEEAVENAREYMKGDEFILTLGLILCEEGHQALVKGQHEVARKKLREARNVGVTAEIDQNSELQKSINRLERALEAYKNGNPLIHGECPEDLPSADPDTG